MGNSISRLGSAGAGFVLGIATSTIYKHPTGPNAAERVIRDDLMVDLKTKK